MIWDGERCLSNSSRLLYKKIEIYDRNSLSAMHMSLKKNILFAFQIYIISEVEGDHGLK